MEKVSAYISKYKLYFKLMSVSGLNIGVHRSITIMKHSVLITDCVRDKSNIYLPKKRLFFLTVAYLGRQQCVSMVMTQASASCLGMSTEIDHLL